MARVPGTFERGDRVQNRDGAGTGTVHHDNRKDGGVHVWVEWDGDIGMVATDPAELRSTQL